MNGGHCGAPGAGSPVLASCSPQKMCSWMLSCCLALQVRGDHGEQPERWGNGERAGILAGGRARAASCQAKGVWGSGQSVLGGEWAVVGTAQRVSVSMHPLRGAGHGGLQL